MFTANQKVEVVNPDSLFYGQTGKIVKKLKGLADDMVGYLVAFADGIILGMGRDELKKSSPSLT